MTWTYKQSTGELFQNGVLIADGYSGHGSGVNNPELQNIRNIGPIPQGEYVICDPMNPPDHLGPVAMALEPEPDTEMFGRDSFFIHGDNDEVNHTGSDGCIILPHEVRETISNSDDRLLEVIA
jgi:hypothetical protein